MSAHFAILGDGAWGTAIALHLAKVPGRRVVLWSARETNANILRDRRENVTYLPGVPIPESIELTADIGSATGADLIVAAVPTVYLRETLKPIAKAFVGQQPVLSLAKGLEIDTFLRPTEIIRQVLGDRPVAALSGPSHAEEVSRGLPTSVVVAAEEFELARQVQEQFNSDHFRVYTNRDLLGVELGGALKNVIGIAAGICDGLGFGDNTKSALLTRGLAELARFGVALGAQRETFFGLAGIGDLITTCISQHGRNRRVGQLLGQGQKLAEILANMKMVAEGVYTTRSVHDRTQRMNIDMPITSEVFRVLYEGKGPLDAVTDLMMREPKGEQSG